MHKGAIGVCYCSVCVLFFCLFVTFSYFLTQRNQNLSDLKLSGASELHFKLHHSNTSNTLSVLLGGAQRMIVTAAETKLPFETIICLRQL